MRRCYYKTFLQRICLQGENDVQADIKRRVSSSVMMMIKINQGSPLIPLSEITPPLNHIILLASYD